MNSKGKCVLGLIHIMYKQGDINTATYELIKKHISEKYAGSDKISPAIPMEASVTTPKRGRKEKAIEEWDDYVKLVEEGKITVVEACEKSKIGRTTYYRRYREWKNG